MVTYNFEVHAATVEQGLRLAHQQCRSFFLSHEYEIADFEAEDEIMRGDGAVVAREIRVRARGKNPDLIEFGREA